MRNLDEGTPNEQVNTLHGDAAGRVWFDFMRSQYHVKVLRFALICILHDENELHNTNISRITISQMRYNIEPQTPRKRGEEGLRGPYGNL